MNDLHIVGHRLGGAHGLVCGGAGLSGHAVVDRLAARRLVVLVAVAVATTTMAVAGFCVSQDGGDKAQGNQELERKKNSLLGREEW